MNNPQNNFSIGVAQLNPMIGDLSGNAAAILTAAKSCADRGVKLLLTPELSLCGYPPRDLLMHDRFVQDMSISLQHLAQYLPSEIAVLVGTVEPNPNARTSGGKPLFNSAALLQSGKIQQIFHKRLLPTYDVFDEDRYFEPGSCPNFFTLKVEENQIRIGVTICEDAWNDRRFWDNRLYADDPVADLAAQDVDLLVNLSASPYAVGKQKLRAAMLSHSALQHNLPLIYANQVGANDDLIFDGGSMAFDRHGDLMGCAATFQEDLMLLVYDFEQKDLIPAAVFPESDLNLPPSPQFWGDKIQIDYQIENSPESVDREIFEALVLGVSDYARKCGFKQAVIGLSGGVDSALVAAIAVAAIGSQNVLGVLMPSPYSSDHSISDALELANNLGIETQIIPIEPMMSAFDRSLSSLFEGTSSGIAEENLQSRIRGSLLMAIANKFGHLLLSTGNKSEMSVGYCTLYGDMNGGLAVISDLPKTRVYSLCEWINRSNVVIGEHQPRIPTHILTKPPSAELKPDQVDQDSLPPYEILDDILAQLIDRYTAPAEIVASGHDPAIVDRVIQLVTRAEFKRRQAPPGLKISDRAFGSGWRMPIASKRTVIT